MLVKAATGLPRITQVQHSEGKSGFYGLFFEVPIKSSSLSEVWADVGIFPAGAN